VDHGGGLKGVVWPLMVHVATGQPSQFALNERYELSDCLLVPLATSPKKTVTLCGACSIYVAPHMQCVPFQLVGYSTSIQAKDQDLNLRRLLRHRPSEPTSVTHRAPLNR
jgi:hypothetical protein